MRLDVVVEDVVLSVQAGRGNQTLSWLAQVACTQYGLLQNGSAHQYTPLRLERVAGDGELLPNLRSRQLSPLMRCSSLADGSRVRLWASNAAMGEKAHFSDAVNEASSSRMPRDELTVAPTAGFSVVKGQNEQDALRRVIHQSAHTSGFDGKPRLAHASLHHVVNPSSNSVATGHAIANLVGEVKWAQLMQHAWDSVDIFDLVVKPGTDRDHGGDGDYSDKEKGVLLAVATMINDNLDDLSRVFRWCDERSTQAPPEKINMTSFFRLMQRANVMHPSVGLAHFDRIFVQPSWDVTHKPALDYHAREMSFGEFLESLVRVAHVRYSFEGLDLVKAVEALLMDKILPACSETLVPEDEFRKQFHTREVQTLLLEKHRLLLAVFTSFAAMDPELHFHTLGLTHWLQLCAKLEIVADDLSFRVSREAYWQASGAFHDDEHRQMTLAGLGSEAEIADGDQLAEGQEMNFTEFSEALARCAAAKFKGGGDLLVAADMQLMLALLEEKLV